MSHTKCIQSFTRRLRDRDLVFDEPILNTVFDGTIFLHRDQVGANLSRTISLDRRFKIAMAKIADYKEEEWRRRNRVGDFRNHSNKKLRDHFRNQFTCSIFEFPYYMRLRASYRDFAFIEGVSTAETAQYFQTYFGLTMAFYQVLDELKEVLVRARS